MSWEATEWARKQRVGDSGLKLVLITLGNYANEDGESWYGMARICHDTEIPERTLRRKLAELVKLKLIEIEPRARKDGTKTSSLIRLFMGRDPAAKMAGGEGQRTTANSDQRPNSQRPKRGVSTGQKGGVPAAIYVAGQDSQEKQDKQITIADDTMDAALPAEKPEDFGVIFDTQFMPKYPKRDGGRDAPKGRLKFIALCKTGTAPADLIAAVIRYATWCDAQAKTGTEYVMQVPRFFNSGGHLESWTIPPPRGGGPRGAPSFNSIASQIENRDKGK